MGHYPRDNFNPEELAAETVFFSLDGDDYVINLTEEHAAELREKLAPFTEKARKVGEVSILALRGEFDNAENGGVTHAYMHDLPFKLTSQDSYPPGVNWIDYFYPPPGADPID